MKNLTTSEKSTLDLAVEWSMMTNGADKTISMINDGSLLPAYNKAFQSFYEKMSGLSKEIIGAIAERTYIALHQRDFNLKYSA
jgi:hypothetical protein